MSLRFILTVVCLSIYALPALGGGGHNHDNYVAPRASTGSTTGSTTYTGTSSPNSGVSGVTGSTLDQQQAQVAAQQMNSGVSAQVVSLGVASCAEAATSLDQNKAASGVLVGSCLDSFQAANGLNAVAGAAADNAGINHSGELSANQAMLDSAEAQKLFDDLNKKYGTDKDAFVKKLVAAKGDPAVLGTQESLNELFNGKISRSDVDAALAAAGGLTDGERQEILDSSVSKALADEAQPGELIRGGGVGAKLAGAKNTALRDSLRSQLAKEESSSTFDNSTAADRRLASAKKPLFPGLKPMEAAPFGDEQNADESSDENLTLFDVVHLKYQVVSARFAGK